jgi:hypothetical protein
VPWLLVTEIVRNIAIGFGLLFLLLPGIYFGFRLAVATEAVVLDEPHLSRAFQRSYRYMQGRFERWLEMIVASVGLVLLCALFGALLSIGIPDPGFKTWTLVTELLIVAMLPFIVYAWTFFYLRLSEAAGDMGREVGPMYAAETNTAAHSSRPPLTLVEPSAPTEAQDPPDTDPRPSQPETHNWG